MNRQDRTTPIVNVLGKNIDVDDFLLTSFVIGRPKVDAHKERLGRQNYTRITIHNL